MLKKAINFASKKIGRKRLFNDYVGKISRDPLNHSLHFQYAIAALKSNRPYLALAELKTAEYLGAGKEVVEEYRGAVLGALPDPEVMNHNRYYRLLSLSSELLERNGNQDFSVLDVGGGEGDLASFIPDATYCLAEPGYNGISGEELPFPDCSFDYVVSCHVLEHIPLDERQHFLDQLLSKCKYGLILLNPFHIEGTHAEERHRLVIDVTGQEWAREHLECSLPRKEYIEDYARKRNLEVNIKPNASSTTALALVFVNYFARKAGLKSECEKVNKFYNTRLSSILDSEKYPVGYTVFLGRSQTSKEYARA